MLLYIANVLQCMCRQAALELATIGTNQKKSVYGMNTSGLLYGSIIVIN